MVMPSYEDWEILNQTQVDYERIINGESRTVPKATLLKIRKKNPGEAHEILVPFNYAGAVRGLVEGTPTLHCYGHHDGHEVREECAECYTNIENNDGKIIIDKKNTFEKKLYTFLIDNEPKSMTS